VGAFLKQLATLLLCWLTVQLILVAQTFQRKRSTMVQAGSITVISLEPKPWEDPVILQEHVVSPLLKLMNMKAPTLHEAIKSWAPLLMSSRTLLSAATAFWNLFQDR
jgi:purine nucleoside permease